MKLSSKNTLARNFLKVELYRHSFTCISLTKPAASILLRRWAKEYMAQYGNELESNTLKSRAVGENAKITRLQ